MSMKRNVIIDANAYIGDNLLFGKFSAFEMPVIKNTTIDCKDLGSSGTYKLPTGKIEALEAKATLNSFYSDVFATIANPYTAVDMTIYSNVQNYTNDTVTSNQSVKLFLRGTSAQFPLLGNFKEHENINTELTFNLSAARLVVDGVELYNIDIPNNIFVVNGVDIRAQVNANLGL